MSRAVSLDVVSVRNRGAVGDGAADDTLAIQAALDSGVRQVLIPAGVFVISDALRPHSGQDLEIRGTLKIADAHIQPLTADAPASQPCLEVADARGFRVGQWVTLCADDSPKWQTRLHADGGRIAAIEGRTLRLEGRLTMAYRVAAHARVATQSSAIWLNDVSHVRIFGSGTIDGNKANQLDVRPTVLDGCGLRAWGSIGGVGGEEIRAACGIAASGAPGTLEYITIEGITIRDASEHNLCLCGLAYGRILNTVCTGARDKNMTLLDSRDCLIAGNIASLSEHEDGIMFHQKTGNARILVQGNICTGNPRQGIAVGAEERDIHLSGNLCADNGCNLSISGIDCSSTGDTCRGENYTRFPRTACPMGAAFAGKNTHIANLSVTGDRQVLVELMGEDFSWMGGCVRGRRESGDNVGILLGLSANVDAAVLASARITIRDLTVTGCRAAVVLRGRMDDVLIADNRLAGNDCAVERGADVNGQVTFFGNKGVRPAGGGTDE